MMNLEVFEENIRENWKGLPGGAGELVVRSYSPEAANSEASEDWTAGERRVLSCMTDPARRGEWIAARRAERTVIALLRARHGAFELSKARTSVSHTIQGERGLVVCAGLFAADENSGIGVDLESEHRRIDEKIRARLLQPEEERFSSELALLDFWVIKEACFKAHPKNDGLVLPLFEIVSWDGAQGEARGPGGALFQFFVMTTHGFKFALAQTFQRR